MVSQKQKSLKNDVGSYKIHVSPKLVLTCLQAHIWFHFVTHLPSETPPKPVVGTAHNDIGAALASSLSPIVFLSPPKDPFRVPKSRLRAPSLLILRPFGSYVELIRNVF